MVESEHDSEAHDGDEQQGQAFGLNAELYGQLRRLAHFHLRSHKKDITLNCTALVHEAFLKLQASKSEIPASPSSYASVASMAMRQILVDYVRSKKTQKSGGGAVHVTLQESAVAAESPTFDLLELDEAMQRLGAKDELLERLVVLRFFAGFSTAETAVALERSQRSVERDWARARVYLYRELNMNHGA